MDKSAEKLKALIKGKVGEKPSYGTDPNEPWSAKAGITEDTISEDELLNRYMKTRGINPETASKISKISASKTGDFEKWKRDHVSGGRLPMPKTEEAGHLGDFPKLKGSEHVTHRRKAQCDRRKHVLSNIPPLRGPGYHSEEVDKKDAITMDIPLLIRVLELAREDIKDDLEIHRVVERLIDIRNNGILTMDDYNFVAGLKEEYIPENKKREMSKSARMIKALYKKHRMVKEETYDHEKEDKSVATYGKKPKFDKADKDDSIGEKKPEAAAVMSGGTTLTKQTRDTIEIDPMMRVRPGQPDPFKKDDKDKDKKKEEKK